MLCPRRIRLGVVRTPNVIHTTGVFRRGGGPPAPAWGGGAGPPLSHNRRYWQYKRYRENTHNNRRYSQHKRSAKTLTKWEPPFGPPNLQKPSLPNGPACSRPVKSAHSPTVPVAARPALRAGGRRAAAGRFFGYTQKKRLPRRQKNQERKAISKI